MVKRSKKKNPQIFFLILVVIQDIIWIDLYDLVLHHRFFVSLKSDGLIPTLSHLFPVTYILGSEFLYQLWLVETNDKKSNADMLKQKENALTLAFETSEIFLSWDESISKEHFLNQIYSKPGIRFFLSYYALSGRQYATWNFSVFLSPVTQGERDCLWQTITEISLAPLSAQAKAMFTVFPRNIIQIMKMSTWFLVTG